MGNKASKQSIDKWNDDSWCRAVPAIKYFIPIFGHPIDTRSFMREANYTTSDDHIFGTFIMTPAHQPILEKITNQELLDRYGVFDPDDYQDHIESRDYHYPNHATGKKLKGNPNEQGCPRWLPFEGDQEHFNSSFNHSPDSHPTLFVPLPAPSKDIPLLTIKQLDISTRVYPSACLGPSSSLASSSPSPLPHSLVPETIPYLRISALTPPADDPKWVEPILSQKSWLIIAGKLTDITLISKEIFHGPFFGLRPLLPPLPLEKFTPILSKASKCDHPSSGLKSKDKIKKKSKKSQQLSESPPSTLPTLTNDNFNHFEYPIPICYSIVPCYQYDLTPVLERPSDPVSPPSYPLHLATILLIDLTSSFGPITFYSFIRETISLLSKGSTLPLIDVPIFILTIGKQYLDDNNAILTEYSMKEALIQLGFSDISFYNAGRKTNENSFDEYISGPHSRLRPPWYDPVPLNGFGGMGDFSDVISGLVPQDDYRSFVEPIHAHITRKHFEILSQGHFDRSKRFPGETVSKYEKKAPNTHRLLKPISIASDFVPMKLSQFDRPLIDFPALAKEANSHVIRYYQASNEFSNVESPHSQVFPHRYATLRSMHLNLTLLRMAYKQGLHPLQLSTPTKPKFTPLKPTPSPLYYLFNEYHQAFYGSQPKWIESNGPNGTTFIGCSDWNYYPDSNSDAKNSSPHNSPASDGYFLQHRIPFISNPLPDCFMRGYQERIAWLEENFQYKTPMGYQNITMGSNTWLSNGQTETHSADAKLLPRDLYYRNPYDVLHTTLPPEIQPPVVQPSSQTTKEEGEEEEGEEDSTISPTLLDQTSAPVETISEVTRQLIGTLTTSQPDFLPHGQLPAKVHFETLIYITHDYLLSLHGYPESEQYSRYTLPTLVRENGAAPFAEQEAIEIAQSRTQIPQEPINTTLPGVVHYLMKTSPSKEYNDLEFCPVWGPVTSPQKFDPIDTTPPGSPSEIEPQMCITRLLISQFGQFPSARRFLGMVKLWSLAGTGPFQSKPYPSPTFPHDFPVPVLPHFLSQLHPTTAQQLSHFHTTSTHTVNADVIGHEVEVNMTYTTISSWNICNEDKDFYAGDTDPNKFKHPGPPPRPVPFWLPQYQNNSIITPLQYVHSVVVLPFAYSLSQSHPLPLNRTPPIPSIGLPFDSHHPPDVDIYGPLWTTSRGFKLPPGLLQSHSPVTFLILCTNPIIEDLPADQTLGTDHDTSNTIVECPTTDQMLESRQTSQDTEPQLGSIPRKQFEFFRNNMPRITKYELIYRQFSDLTMVSDSWIDPQRLEVLWDVQFIHTDDFSSIFGQLEQAAVANRLKMFAAHR